MNKRTSAGWSPLCEQLQKWNYMEAFLKEVLRYGSGIILKEVSFVRLHPSVPGDGKYAVAADILPDGNYCVPAGGFLLLFPFHMDKGTFVSWSNYSMGRLEQIWGPTVEQFDPSRWLGEKSITPFEVILFCC